VEPSGGKWQASDQDGNDRGAGGEMIGYLAIALGILVLLLFGALIIIADIWRRTDERQE
jgi:hypothetical protein